MGKLLQSFHFPFVFCEHEFIFLDSFLDRSARWLNSLTCTRNLSFFLLINTAINSCLINSDFSQIYSTCFSFPFANRIFLLFAQFSDLIFFVVVVMSWGRLSSFFCIFDICTEQFYYMSFPLTRDLLAIFSIKTSSTSFLTPCLRYRTTVKCQLGREHFAPTYRYHTHFSHDCLLCSSRKFRPTS